LCHSCNAASTVVPLGSTLPSAKSFRRFSKSFAGLRFRPTTGLQ
jgi:hypothetical protein